MNKQVVYFHCGTRNKAYGLVWLVVAWRLASTMKVLDSPSLEIYGLPIGIIIIIIIIWILKKWYLYVILRVF